MPGGKDMRKIKYLGVLTPILLGEISCTEYDLSIDLAETGIILVGDRGGEGGSWVFSGCHTGMCSMKGCT